MNSTHTAAKKIIEIKATIARDSYDARLASGGPAEFFRQCAVGAEMAADAFAAGGEEALRSLRASLVATDANCNVLAQVDVALRVAVWAAVNSASN